MLALDPKLAVCCALMEGGEGEGEGVARVQGRRRRGRKVRWASIPFDFWSRRRDREDGTSRASFTTSRTTTEGRGGARCDFEFFRGGIRKRHSGRNKN